MNERDLRHRDLLHAMVGLSADEIKIKINGNSTAKVMCQVLGLIMRVTPATFDTIFLWKIEQTQNACPHVVLTAQSVMQVDYDCAPHGVSDASEVNIQHLLGDHVAQELNNRCQCATAQTTTKFVAPNVLICMPDKSYYHKYVTRDKFPGAFEALTSHLTTWAHAKIVAPEKIVVCGIEYHLVSAVILMSIESEDLSDNHAVCKVHRDNRINLVSNDHVYPDPQGKLRKISPQISLYCRNQPEESVVTRALADLTEALANGQNSERRALAAQALLDGERQRREASERELRNTRASREAAQRDRDNARAVGEAALRDRDTARAVGEAALRDRDNARAVGEAALRDRHNAAAVCDAALRELHQERSRSAILSRDARQAQMQLVGAQRALLDTQRQLFDAQRLLVHAGATAAQVRAARQDVYVGVDVPKCVLLLDVCIVISICRNNAPENATFVRRCVLLDIYKVCEQTH